MSSVFRVLQVGISVEDADPEVAAESVRVLREELLDLDVDAIRQAAGEPAPPGAKGLGDGAFGLVVTLSNSAVLVALAGVLRSWVSRDRERKVRVRIGEDFVEIDRASEQEQARLIEAWLDRHVGQ